MRTLLNMNVNEIKTLGGLKKTDYKPMSVKDELRKNLIVRIKEHEPAFPGIFGFDHTVIPDLERAILSGHSILLLGLRGQAKTRIARQLLNLLDEYVPIVEGSKINDDPFNPVSNYAKSLIEDKGDETPIAWLHRSERYIEKLATPDVSIADLIGDIDPILAATLKLPYSDERVIHYGLIPRSNRCIFVINELPDLQPRIQVSLFNMLQEKDIQIRGYELRWPLDIEFIFTANPEDYTNRGNIVTPLKDRIESQILTHYPENIEIAKQITAQEANIHAEVLEKIRILDFHKNILERIVFVSRNSDLVDNKSGVSARLSITALENLFSAAERRMLMNGETSTTIRLTDFRGVIPNIIGKIELEYEGEQEGSFNVAMQLLGEAIHDEFLEHFPDPDVVDEDDDNDPYGDIVDWFSDKNVLELLYDESDQEFIKKLYSIERLAEFVQSHIQVVDELPQYMELVLFSLAEFNLLNREVVESKITFGDYLADILDDLDNVFGEDPDDDEDELDDF